MGNPNQEIDKALQGSSFLPEPLVTPGSSSQMRPRNPTTLSSAIAKSQKDYNTKPVQDQLYKITVSNNPHSQYYSQYRSRFIRNNSPPLSRPHFNAPSNPRRHSNTHFPPMAPERRYIHNSRHRADRDCAWSFANLAGMEGKELNGVRASSRGLCGVVVSYYRIREGFN